MEKDQFMNELNLLRKKVVDLERENRLFKETEKKLIATNQQLKESEQLLKTKRETLLHTQKIARVGSWDWDVASDRVYWSDELFEIFRLDPANSVDFYPDHTKFFTPGSTQQLAAAVNKILEDGKPFEIDVEIIRADGVIAFCTTRGVAKKDEKGEVVRLFGIFQDITGRKISEEELKVLNHQLQAHEQQLKATNESLTASEKQFRQLFENMEQGFALHEMIHDDDGNPIDYRFILINNAFKELTGTNTSNYIGKTVKQVLPGIEQFWIDNYGKVAQTGRPIQFEHFSHEFDRYYSVTAYSPEKNFFATLFTDTTQDKLLGNQLLEAKLKAEENEEKFRQMFQFSPDSIIIHDMEMNIIDFNLRALEEFGYKKEEFINKTVFELHSNDELPNFQKFLNKMKKQDMLKVETKFVKKDGSTFLAEVIPCKYTLGGKSIIHVVIRNITEIKRAEQELITAKEKAEQSEAKFKLLNHLTSEMLMLHDMESIYEFIAKKLQKHYPNTIVLVVSIDEANRQSRLEVVSGLDNSLLTKVIKILGINPIGKTYKLTDTHNNYFKSGSFIEFDGGLVEFSASEFSVFVASAFQKLIGLHKIYTIGINKDDELLAAIHFFTFNKQVIIDGDFIEVFVAQAGLVLQKKINEKDLKNAKKKAEESDRLKSAFLANMSHEIRTPMNGILGFTDLLKEPKLSGAERDKYVSIIESSGNRLLNTVNDLIDFSKIEAGQMKASISYVNINELIDELFLFFNVEAQRKGLQLFIDTSSLINNMNLLSDKEKIYSILTNLIKNAIKYTQSGRVEFGYTLRKATEPVELEFFVKDTGSGIPKEKLAVIFERFIRVDNDEKFFSEGGGLGLSIAKAYVEMLGGKIWVESEVGIGSQFYFTIPFETAKNKEFTSEATSKPQINKNISGLKILIAEDDEYASSLLTILIKDISKEILHAKSGVKVVELCRNNSDIDLILMDINMPEMDGYEATRQIREFNKEVIIIAQTAYALAGDHEKSIEAGCNAHISKPIMKDELLSLIQQLVTTDHPII